MGKRILALLLSAALGITMVACSSGGEKKEEEAPKEAVETEETADKEAVDAITSTLDELSDTVTLKDENTIVSLREQIDALTDEEKAMIPAASLEKLGEAEQRITKLKKIKKKRAAERKANKEAASVVTKLIEGLPDDIKIKDESRVSQARQQYDALTDAQKELVDQSSVSKLESAESTIEKLNEKKQKIAEKKAAKRAEKKKAKEESKDQASKADDTFAVAKKYVGKKASALTSKIGKPKKVKKEPNCATDGEEFYYFYDGFYAWVQSKDMDSPLIVLAVKKS